MSRVDPRMPQVDLRMTQVTLRTAQVILRMTLKITGEDVRVGIYTDHKIFVFRVLVSQLRVIDFDYFLCRGFVSTMFSSLKLQQYFEAVFWVFRRC